jgi:CheY-like chemotaxis protein
MSKGSILVVEDNMDNYELVRFVLERAGYDVFLAVNGRDGVDAGGLRWVCDEADPRAKLFGNHQWNV